MIGNSKKQKNQNLKKKVLDLEGPPKERSMFGKVYRLNPWTLFSVPFEGPGIDSYSNVGLQATVGFRAGPHRHQRAAPRADGPC